MSIQFRPSDWQCGLTLGETIQYAYENEIACDVTFQLGKDEVHAHRLILSLRSPVFFAMFNGLLKNTEAAVNVPDVELLAFRELMRYIYKDDAVINTSNAVHTLYAAKKYMVPGLVTLCTSFLESSVHLDNVCTLLEQGMQVDEQPLVDRCLNLIMLKSNEVFASTHWLTMSQPAVAKVLECPSLSVSEVEVFNSCVAWSIAACEQGNKPPVPKNQRSALGDLLYKVNMTNLNLTEFSEVVVPTGLLDDKEELAVFKKLTNPALRDATPFATGRQNGLLLLKPLHILDLPSAGECNYDSESFVFAVKVHHPLRILELHLYDLIGPHVINITIKPNKPSNNGLSNSSSDRDSPAPGYTVRDLTHQRQYMEKGYRVFVFKLANEVNLCSTNYEFSITMIGEFDTALYDPLQFGDKNITVSRAEKESPLFGLGYIVEDPDSKNPKPAAVGTMQVKSPPPPVPPRKKSLAEIQHQLHMK